MRFLGKRVLVLGLMLGVIFGTASAVGPPPEFNHTNEDEFWSAGLNAYVIPNDAVNHFVDETVTLTEDLIIDGTLTITSNGISDGTILTNGNDVYVKSGGILNIFGRDGNAGGILPPGTSSTATLIVEFAGDVVTVESGGSLNIKGGDGGAGADDTNSILPDGGDGGNGVLQGNGSVNIETGGAFTITGGLGGNGGDFTNDSFNKGGNGGNGGDGAVAPTAGRTLVINIEIITNLFIHAGNGGNGGLNQVADDGGSSLAGKGGNGGDAIINGDANFNSQEIGTFELIGGTGGNGGDGDPIDGGSDSTGGGGGDGGSANIQTGGFNPNDITINIKEGNLINVLGGHGGNGGSSLSSSGPYYGNGGNGGHGGEAELKATNNFFRGYAITMNVTGGNGGNSGDSGSGGSPGGGGNGGDSSADSEKVELDVEAIENDVIVTLNVADGTDNDSIGGTATALTTHNEIRATDGTEFVPDNIFDCLDFVLTLSQELYINFVWEINCNKKIVGNGNKIVIGPDGEIVIDGDVDVEFCDLDIEGLHSASPSNLRCTSDDGEITITDVVLKQDGNFTFDRGTLKINGHCFIDAPGYVFKLYGTYTPWLRILANSKLELLKNTTFEYDVESSEWRFSFEDVDSKLILRDATFLGTENVSFADGILICKGEATLFGDGGTIYIYELTDIDIRGGLTKLGNVDWTPPI